MTRNDYPWEWYEVPEEDYDGTPGYLHFIHNGYEVVEYDAPGLKRYNIMIAGTDTCVAQLPEPGMRALIGWEDV